MITEHRIEHDHNFNWDKVRIKDKENNLFEREISEMIYIKNNKRSLNSQKDIPKFNSTYSPIIVE